MEFTEAHIKNTKTRASQDELPSDHKRYLRTIRDNFDFNPKVIYDIGSCVLHWTTEAEKVWDSEIILFDAFPLFENLYQEKGYKYHIGVLSDELHKDVTFFYHPRYFGGSSYYKENPKYGISLFRSAQVLTKTLDQVVEEQSFNMPDLMKLDVQGSELDILRGAEKCLQSCKHLIVELRKLEYNLGSPAKEEVLDFLRFKGFKNIGCFSSSDFDGDYHFIKE